MGKNPRGNRPYIRPVTKLELDQSNTKLRWILVAVLLVIGIVAFGIGIHDALETDPGWQTVRAYSDKPNCGAEFVLMYDYSLAGSQASQVSKELETLYSELCENGFVIFSPDISGENLLNVSYVNASVNREIEVDGSLYEAFELLDTYDNRCIFLAPVYAEYEQVFYSESDPEAMEKDPERNPEVRTYVEELIQYTSNEQMISLDLLGNNRIRLNVAPEYLDFAEEHGIEEFVDFGWMRNAFVVDYLAEHLTKAGFTDGYLASYDGFTRNLCGENQSFRLNLFDRQGKDVYLPAVMEYRGGNALVSVRNYPMDELDQWSMYSYDDGRIVTGVIDPADGVNKSARNNMVSYSNRFGCAEILLNMIPVYVADSFSTEAANGMMSRNIFSVWFDNGTLYHNEQTLILEMMADAQGNFYQKALSK